MNFNEISGQRWKLFRVSLCPLFYASLSFSLLFARIHARLLVLFVLIYALYVLLDIRRNIAPARLLSQLFREPAAHERTRQLVSACIPISGISSGIQSIEILIASANRVLPKPIRYP